MRAAPPAPLWYKTDVPTRRSDNGRSPYDGITLALYRGDDRAEIVRTDEELDWSACQRSRLGSPAGTP